MRGIRDKPETRRGGDNINASPTLDRSTDMKLYRIDAQAVMQTVSGPATAR